MRILLIDNHWVARAGMKNVLRDLEDDLDLAEAGSLSEATSQIASNSDLDLILLDLLLSDVDGLEGLAILRERVPQVPIVVFSNGERRQEILDSINLGAVGFIPKSADGAEILKGLRHVLGGGIFLPRSLIEVGEKQRQNDRRSDMALTGRDSLKAILTDRQHEIFELLSKGKTNEEIADELGLSKHTVRIHISAIRAKIGAKNRTQAVVIAGKHFGGQKGD